MRADYFRLCFILAEGGFYVDADDVHRGSSIEPLFAGDLLKLQPLCYEISSDSMVDPIKPTTASDDLIYYVNNNPLIAPAGHPLVRRALQRATDSILFSAANRRDVQALTGPGNLTACLVEYAIEERLLGHEPAVEILPDWETLAYSKWPLDYRSDQRNWRRWTQLHDTRVEGDDEVSA